MLLACSSTMAHAAPDHHTRHAKTQSDSTRIDFQISLPDSLQKVVRETVQQFGRTYGFVSSVSISEDTMTKAAQRTDGSKEVTLARGVSGAIYLNRQAAMTRKSLRKAISHEMFLTLAPDSALFLAQAYSLSASYDVIGYRGLAVLVLYRDRQAVGQIKLAEEAAAEVCAYAIEKVHAAGPPAYSRNASFLKAAVDSGWITPRQLISAEKTNDFRHFCALLCNKKDEAVTTWDLTLVADCFINIANIDGPYGALLSLLSVTRAKQ